jgi:hypothetical protein
MRGGSVEHSYEEIRRIVIDILAGRESAGSGINQYGSLKGAVTHVLMSRDNAPSPNTMLGYQVTNYLSEGDKDCLLFQRASAKLCAFSARL